MTATLKEQLKALNTKAFKASFATNPNSLLGVLPALNSAIAPAQTIGKLLENWLRYIIAQATADAGEMKTIIRFIGMAAVPAYPNTNSRGSFYSKLRNIIAQKYPKGSPVHKYTYKYLMLPKEETNAIHRAYGQHVIEGNSDQYIAHLSDITSIVEAAKPPNAKWWLKAIAAEIATGARVSELLVDSQFLLDPEVKENIIQIGIAKSKIQGKSVSKPTILLTPPEAIQMIAETRAGIKDKVDGYKERFPLITSAEITTRLIQPLNNKLHHMVKLYRADGTRRDGTVSTHDMRRIYGSIAYQLIGSKFPQKISLSGYLSLILGHDVGDFGTANAYSTLIVDLEK
jgi:hypothetical protein